LSMPSNKYQGLINLVPFHPNFTAHWYAHEYNLTMFSRDKLFSKKRILLR
jgi:hypothetical protein